VVLDDGGDVLGGDAVEVQMYLPGGGRERGPLRRERPGGPRWLPVA